MRGAARRRFAARPCGSCFSARRFRRRRPTSTFDLVQDTHNAIHKTARDRLTVHRENPTCAGCHALTDPIGLGMENYDGIGQYRTHENGAPIDASGTFERSRIRI